MKQIVFDIEADDLWPGVSLIHCLSYAQSSKESRNTLTDANDIREFFKQDAIFVGHHIIGYDFKALHKIYGVVRPKLIVDTLPLSWYLYEDRASHGLESWGDDLGVAKPKIEDWKDQSSSDYINRCETDVLINCLLWEKQKKRLLEIYDDK